MFDTRLNGCTNAKRYTEHKLHASHCTDGIVFKIGQDLWQTERGIDILSRIDDLVSPPVDLHT